MSAFRFLLLTTLAMAGLAACDGGDGDNQGGSGGTGTAGSGGDTGAAGGGGAGGGTGGSSVTPACTDPTPVTCTDAVLLDMNLQKDPTPGLIMSEPGEGGWVSHIDATAGGAFASVPDSYTYGKFGSGGLEKVEIGDEDSLTSMDWDIAFRRYVVRINSGDSGPSCVRAARVPMAAYEDVTALPDTLTYHPDDYFTDSCDFIPDGSGLDSSPATALSAYWTYPGCVKMSDYVFVLELADGHHVKLVIDSYYEPSVQDQCDTTDMVPMGNTGAANFVMRWSYLD